MHIVALVATKLLGVTALAVGVAGIVLPVIPGWVLIFIGLNILGIPIFFWHHNKKKRKQKVKA